MEAKTSQSGAKEFFNFGIRINQISSSTALPLPGMGRRRVGEGKDVVEINGDMG